MQSITSSTQRTLYFLSTISTYLFVVIFGLSSWITINGVYSQAPIFIRKLPEGLTIISNMSLMLQLANVFPLAHLLFSALVVSKKYKYLWDSIGAITLIAAGIACTVLLGLLWDHTVLIGGSQVSLWLYIFVFLNGAVDCTSTVIYFPLISNYRFLFSSALTIGEGLTGGVAGILALIQQPGSDKPLFSVFGMCMALAVVMAVSLIAVLLLVLTPLGRMQLRKKEDYHTVVNPEPIGYDESASSSEKEEIVKKQQVAVNHYEYAEHGEEQEQTAAETVAEVEPFGTRDVLRLALIQGLISFTDNGIMMGSTPYILYNYPNQSQLYSYSYNIGLILDPICCFLAYLLPFSGTIMWGFHAAWGVIHSTLFIIALCSPNVPYKDSFAMGVALASFKVAGKCLIAFCKTREFTIAHKKLQKWEEHVGETLQEAGGNQQEKKCSIDVGPFRIAGFSIQFFALAGTLLIVLLTHFNVLKK